MIIVMKTGAHESEIREVIRRIEELGYQAHIIEGTQRTVIGAVGDERGKDRLQSLEVMPGVDTVVPILQPFKLASREVKGGKSIVRVGELEIGGPAVVVMAGPCSVESEAQMVQTARSVKAAGATVLRGGAFKPRTSPYAFQGLAEEGLKFLDTARAATGLKIITEVVNPNDVDLVAAYADILQIGARNVQNFALLKRVGEVGKPVLLKRGMATTIKEFLMAAEYILSEGNYNVALCERGIRTFETSTRFTLDLSAVPVLNKLTHLPVVIDPSHGTGHWEYVAPMAKASVACGADGLLIEVHPTPETAQSDGLQSLKLNTFQQLMDELRPLASAVGRRI
ncbi:MAG: 3-deoxy-7-phosphoheptulonate synthase [Candidatus Methylomirabilota bacterium]|nr:3-deoxy-7-phosphoheptulonate synthase [candidate division NC10 bacterium]PWB42910.1 MAG: 3-deoxy-7-phosphoheptulonate synthase [candidate division NC10 bacterium]